MALADGSFGSGEGVAANVVGYSRFAPGRIAQRESARFTRGRSLVRSQVRPSLNQAAAVSPDRVILLLLGLEARLLAD